MPDWKAISVPVQPRLVQEFLKLERDIFRTTLGAVREQISDAVQTLGVYKIYGREDKQDGAFLKDARKVRLKFNTYFEKLRKPTGSLWSIPDIVGFTIVVAYPSDINLVSKIIDELIETKKLLDAHSGLAKSSPDTPEEASRLIVTKYGRALTDKGYFACHYNLRLPGPGGMLRIDRPICEVQIKTVMHDAWGAKTHDLTYKPAGRTAQELIDSFNVLGDTLALIDRQSDLIRHSIERNARVRDAKRRRLQQAVLGDVVLRRLVPDGDEMAALVHDILAFDPAISTEAILTDMAQRTETFYGARKRPCCAAICLLALRSNNRSIKQRALETLDLWLQDTEEPVERVQALMMIGLANFSFDDVTASIEATEAALDLVNGDPTTKWPTSTLALLYANLAYYHAVRVGSHEGRLGDSASKATTAIENLRNHVANTIFPDEGLDAEPEKILEALDDSASGATSFSMLDSIAFVRIQTTEHESELVEAIEKIKEVYRLVEVRNIAQRWQMTAATRALMIDFNDYCARSRLAELEAKST